MPCIANAWESSVGVGYYGTLFVQKNELGSTTRANIIKPDHSNELAVNGSFLFDINPFIKTGLDLTLGYGRFYVQENINNLQIWNTIVALDIQYTDKDFILQLKPGFNINGITSGYTKKVDIDAGVFSVGLRASIGAFDSQRIFIEPQVIITPSVGTGLIASTAMIVGIEKVFKKKVIEKIIEKPVVNIIELPKEITPVKLPEPETPVVIPEPATPAAPSTLKFDGNDLSQGSNGFLENIVKIHNKLPSIIKIYYSKRESAKKKADSLYSWFIKHDVKEDEVNVIYNEANKKEIKIEVVPK
jgi:hypothetical protein